MSKLPKLKHPTTTITIPSTKQTIKARPYTVKEEKILLMAQGDDSESIADVIKQIIVNCVTSPENFDPSKLPIFDLEYIYLKLRAFSVNNVIELKYKDPDDDKTYELEIDLNDVEVVFDPKHTSQIALTDEVGVVMRYPDLKTMDKMRVEASKIEDSKEAADFLFGIYARSIAQVYDEEGVYNADTDFTYEEICEFLEQVTSEGFDKIKDFFETMPTLKHEVSYMTEKGVVKKITLAGLVDFFQ